MNVTDKSNPNFSEEKSNSSNLFFILSIVLVIGLAVLGGVLGYKWWDRREQRKAIEKARKHIYDVKSLKPEKESKLSAYSEAFNEIKGNHRLAEKIKKLIDQNPSKFGLWKPDLENIQQNLKTVLDLRLVGRDNPEEVKSLRLEAFQEATCLRRLSFQILPTEQVRSQFKTQQEWLENEEERKQEMTEAKQVIGELIDHFYHRFLNELPPEKKNENSWNIDPIQINYQPADPANREADVKHIVSREIPVIFEGERMLVKCSSKPKWTSFGGFFEKSEEAEKKEGASTLGVTIFESAGEIESKGDRFNFVPSRSIKIELKKEFLFHRQNPLYDEWVSDLKKTEKGLEWRNLDISEPCLINVIAHELSHAVIANVYAEYEPKNGGHGTLHDEYMDQIEEMIKGDTVRYENFLAWWRKPWSKNE